MPTISEQFTAVLNALVPFSIAVFVIAGFTFWGGEWLYRSVLNKRKELYALSRLDVDHWKELAERTTMDLDEKIKQLEEQQGLTAETRRQLGAARFEVLRLSDQLTHLGKANYAGLLAPFLGARILGTDTHTESIGVTPESLAEAAPKIDNPAK